MKVKNVPLEIQSYSGETLTVPVGETISVDRLYRPINNMQDASLILHNKRYSFTYNFPNTIPYGYVLDESYYVRIFGGEVNATDLNTGSSVVIPNERYVEIIEVINTGNSDEIMFKGTVNEKYVSFMYNPNTMYLSNESLYSSTVM